MYEALVAPKPFSERFPYATFAFAESCDTLVVTMGFRKLNIPAQWSIAQEILQGFQVAQECSRVNRGLFVFNNFVRDTTSSIRPVLPLSAVHRKTLIVLRLLRNLDTRSFYQFL